MGKDDRMRFHQIMESPHGREEKRPVKKKSKKVVKGAASHKAVDSAIATINDVAASATKAVIAVDKEYKKLSKTAKRLNKKRAALMKKSRSAAKRLKKDANAANKKAATIIKKDIAVIKKEAEKVNKLKSIASEELATLKAASKRAIAYVKGVTSADKALNKPKKKRRKKKVATTA